MHSHQRAKLACVLAAGGTLCAACGEVDRPGAPWPRQSSYAVVAAPAQPDECRAYTAERAEAASGEAAASDEPPECAVRLIVRVEAPADVPLEVSVAVLAVEPTEFRAYGCDPRLLDETLDDAWYRWDPRGQPLSAYDSYGVELRDGHVFFDVPLEDLPTGRDLWLCVYSDWERGWSDYRGFPPRIEKIAALDASGPPHVEHVRLQPRGAIVGRVVDRAPLPPPEPRDDVDDAYEIDDEYDGGEPDDSEEPAYLEVRDLGSAVLDEYCNGGNFALAPLTGGWHRFEIDAESMRQEGVAYRRTISAFVRDGAASDVGTIELGLEPPVLRVRVVDEAGLAVVCPLHVTLRDGPPRAVHCNEHGEVALVGDWIDVERIDYTPWPDSEYGSASIEIDMRVDRERELVLRKLAVPQVAMQVIARAPDGGAGVPTCFVRALGSATWSVLRTYPIGCGGGWCDCGPLEPGSYEIAAWCRGTRWSCRQVIDVAAQAPEEKLEVELRCTDSHTVLTGELRTTYDGAPHATWLTATIALAGSADTGLRIPYENQIRIDSGRFEIAGLPPGIALELRFADDADDSRIACRRGFTLDAGERRDLGVIDIDVR